MKDTRQAFGYNLRHLSRKSYIHPLINAEVPVGLALKCRLLCMHSCRHLKSCRLLDIGLDGPKLKRLANDIRLVFPSASRPYWLLRTFDTVGRCKMRLSAFQKPLFFRLVVAPLGSLSYKAFLCRGKSLEPKDSSHSLDGWHLCDLKDCCWQCAALLSFATLCAAQHVSNDRLYLAACKAAVWCKPTA